MHRASEGISPRTIRELVWRALEQLPPVGRPHPGRRSRSGGAHGSGSGAALDPLPGRPGGAGDRARATEVRRAVHPGARGRVPPAPARRRALRDRARHHGTPARRVRPVVAVHADRRPAPRDRGGRPSDGGAPADEPPPAGRRRVGQDARRRARVPRRDRVGASGRHHGADGGPGRPAPALRRPRCSRATGAAPFLARPTRPDRPRAALFGEAAAAHAVDRPTRSLHRAASPAKIASGS